MNETRIARQSAGLTAARKAGRKSSKVMTDGKETPEMLLALFNNALISMINCQQARIVGTALNRGRRCTIVMVYGTLPTSDGILRAVGNDTEAKK